MVQENANNLDTPPFSFSCSDCPGNHRTHKGIFNYKFYLKLILRENQEIGAGSRKYKVKVIC
jgi:hypothetical protein